MRKVAKLHGRPAGCTRFISDRLREQEDMTYVTRYLNDEEKEEGGISRADYLLEYRSLPFNLYQRTMLAPR